MDIKRNQQNLSNKKLKDFILNNVQEITFLILRYWKKFTNTNFMYFKYNNLCKHLHFNNILKKIQNCQNINSKYFKFIARNYIFITKILKENVKI